MIKDKDEKPAKPSGNGDKSAEILEALRNVASNQSVLTDRLADVEERLDGAATANEAILKLVNLFYNTDDKHIIELSHISPLAARPFAGALTLDMLTDPDVQSGKLSLNKALILNYLRLQRSVRGRHFGLGVSALQDQVNAEGQKEDYPEMDAGTT